jgi:hypothetical protein
MELRQLIRPDITASAIVHLSVLVLIFLFTEVHPFSSVTAEPIAVDLVTADEVAKKPEPPPQTPPPDFSESPKPAAAGPSSPAAQPAASPPAASAPPQQQAALSPQRSGRREAAAAEPQVPPQAQPASPQPAFTPPEPDLTIKYHVMLGLPEDLPPPVSSGDKPGDGFDATASAAADISSSLIAEFRRHLKTCAKLPASVAPSDNIMVKLRVLMTPEGRLAAEPLVGGGSANLKAFDLIKSATEALQACQPYTMLPVDRYGEWKVLDLTFTPRDFVGSS